MCDDCEGKMYVMALGSCSKCSGTTTSRSFIYCSKCAALLEACKVCGKPNG